MNKPTRNVREDAILIRGVFENRVFHLTADPEDPTPEADQIRAIRREAIAFWRSQVQIWRQVQALYDLHKLAKEAGKHLAALDAMLPDISRRVSLHNLDALIAGADEDDFLYETPWTGGDWQMAVLAFDALATFLAQPLGEGLPSLSDLTVKL